MDMIQIIADELFIDHLTGLTEICYFKLEQSVSVLTSGMSYIL